MLVLLSPYSYEDEVILDSGTIKKYQFSIIGESAGMMHTEGQMLWPTYYESIYLVHVDSSVGEFIDSQFVISAKDKRPLTHFKGNITITKKMMIVKVNYCNSQNECKEASFNGVYVVVNTTNI